jgi:preprotein translocase SecE subunit
VPNGTRRPPPLPVWFDSEGGLTGRGNYYTIHSPFLSGLPLTPEKARLILAGGGFVLNKIREFMKFVREAYEELKKVSWLSRAQMIASTWLVILLVIFFAVLVFAFDRLLLIAFKFFI